MLDYGKETADERDQNVIKQEVNDHHDRDQQGKHNKVNYRHNYRDDHTEYEVNSELQDVENSIRKAVKELEDLRKE
jgi:hypothetical protein